MFKYSLLVAALAVAVLGSVAFASTASTAVFTFSTDGFFTTYPAGPSGTRATQLDARRLINGADSNTWSTQASYDTVVNWMGQVGAGEGVKSFQLWLHPDWYASSSGVILGLNPLGSASSPAPVYPKNITVQGPDGWTGSVVTSDDMYNGIIQWSTSDPDKYIRPGSQLGDFSFTADVAEYATGAYTGNVVYGKDYRVFFWAPGTDSVVDNNFTSDSAFYAFQNITAQPVPEPVTMISTFLAISGLGGYIRRRMSKKA